MDSMSCDTHDLLRLPRGTFGYEYARWMVDHGFAPVSDCLNDEPEDPEVRYLRHRILEIHDFWHVLSGYDCDPAGELGLLAFTYGQSRARGVLLQLLRAVASDVLASWHAHRRPWSPLIPYLWRAARRGRKARFLVPVVLEDYLHLPIGSVRQRFEIEPLEGPFSRDVLPPIAARA